VIPCGSKLVKRTTFAAQLRGHLRPGAGSEPTIEVHAKDDDAMYARSELNIHNDGDRYQARQRWCSDHSIMQVIDVQHVMQVNLIDVMPIRCITMYQIHCVTMYQ
jgi:hypothetical protein